MKHRTFQERGFTLVEILIVVTILSLLATIAIPNYVRARSFSQASACVNNLRQIDGAVQQWALETQAAPSATPSYAEISAYLKSQVACPAGGTNFSQSYQLNGVTNKPTCVIGSAMTPPHIFLADTSE